MITDYDLISNFDFMTDFNGIERHYPYPFYPAGVYDEDKMQYKYGPASKEYPNLKLSENLYDQYGNSISAGYYMVVLSFDKKFDIPADSSVTIETDGLLGAKHVELTPGADEEILESGDTLAYTQDVLLLDELLNKLNTYMAKKKEVKEENKIEESSEIQTEEVMDET